MHTAEDVIQALRQISSPDADSHRFFFDGLGETKVIGVGIGKVFPIAKAHRLICFFEQSGVAPGDSAVDERDGVPVAAQ